MTFRKTVLAYLTGWLIVQPTWNRLLAAYRRREINNPSAETRVYWEWQARAIVDELRRREPSPSAADAIVIDSARDVVRRFLAGPPLGDSDLGWALHVLHGALDELDERKRGRRAGGPEL